MDIQTWNGYDINDGTNYESYFVSPVLGNARVQANMVKRHGRFPLVGGVTRPDDTMMIEIIVRAADAVTALATLRTIFETESGEIKTLVIDGSDGTEEYVQAVCEALYEEESHLVMRAILRIHDDTSWRATAVSSDTETVTASDQEWTITNGGDQIARPTITITPRDTQPNINAYRRFVAVQWRGDGAADYSTDITNNAWDTAALVTASKLQADGDDIRVLVNGIAVDYWLDDINSDNTSVWVNLTWQKAISLTAAAAIADTGTVETVDVNQDISAMPSTGILMIDNELFLYTSKNNSLRRFTILARAAHGTAAAAHTVGDTVYWIQHAIELQYGNDDFAAWPSHASRKPAFELATSTNAAWDYDGFGDRVLGESVGDAIPVVILPASWQYTGGLMQEGVWLYTCYTASQFPNAPGGSPFTTSPWAVAGLYQGAFGGYPIIWRRHCPCGITAVNFQNGYKYAGAQLTNWNGYIVSSVDGSLWTNEYTIPDPSALTTWQTWSQNETTLTANSRYIGLELGRITAAGGAGHYLEAGDVTLTFDTNLTPLAYIAPEAGNYTVEATLTHVESGWALQISFPGAVDQSLVINTDTGEITSTADGSSQFQAVRRFPRPRVEWLPLLPGVNTLRWTEPGVVEMDVALQWRERRGA